MQDTPTLFWKLSEWIAGVPIPITVAMVVLGAIALVLLIRMADDEDGDRSTF